MKDNTWLAGFFNRVREVIEAAETPFAKLAVFVLPILSPLIPAFFTGMHVYKLMIEVFDFGENISAGVGFIVGLVLEMLGYVGAIEFIGAVFRLVRHKDDTYWLPITLTGVAYLFYLIAMFMINVELGKYFNTPNIVNNIVGLLSFITIPTGLLAANHLGKKEDKEETDILRQEKREDKLKSKALKAGINIFAENPLPTQIYESTVGGKSPSQPKSDWRLLTPEEKRLVIEVLSIDEIMHKHQVGRSTAFAWKGKKV